MDRAEMVAAMNRNATGNCFALVDTLVAVLLLVFIAGVCALLSVMLSPAADAAAKSPSVVAHPAQVLHFEAPAPVRQPDGSIVVLPAGSEVGACGVDPLRYDAEARLTRVPQPCIDERVFADSFEAR